MTVFNINTFKSKMDQYGGPARKNLFTVEFVSSDQTVMGRDLVFFCKDVNVPGVHMNTVEHRTDAYNMPTSMVMGMERDQLSAIFMLDDDHSILTFFHEWMQKIYNFDESAGRYAPRAGTTDHLPHTINYKEDYSCRMIVKIYSINGSFYEMVFDGVFPSQIASLNLGWAFNGDIQDMSVSFSYTSMKVAGTRAGAPGDVPFIRISGTSESEILNLNLPTFLTDLRKVVNNTSKAIKGIKTLFS